MDNTDISPSRSEETVITTNPYIAKGEVYSASGHLYTLVEQQLILVYAAGQVHRVLPATNKSPNVIAVRNCLWRIVSNFMDNRKAVIASLSSLAK